MKRHFIQLITALFAVVTFSTSLYAAEQTLTIDNKHSYVLWSIKHLGFSTQSGKWYANGQLVIDPDHLDKSRVDVTININDMVTGLPDLDKHLKGKLFFDSAKFPTATFVSTSVKVLSNKTAQVTGDLTLRGVTKPITLNVVLNKVGVNPISEKKTAGFTATALIKRSDFGMDALLPDLGDEVSVVINVEAYEDKK